MLLKVSQRSLIDWLIAIPLIIVGLLSFESDNKVLIAYLTLFVSIVNFWKARKSIFHLIIFGFILFSNYSVCFSLYIKPIEGIYTTLVDTKYGSISICILLIFNALLLLLGAVKSGNIDYSEKYITPQNYNPIIAMGAVALLLLILVVGFTRPDGEGERGGVSSYYEYAAIIFIIGFMYSGNNSFFKLGFLGIAALYCIQDLTYGGRITSLQLIIMIYLVLFHDKRVNIIKMAPVALLGLMLFSAVGEMRGNFNFSISSLLNAFKSLFNGSFSLDTAYAAYYASQVFVNVSFMDPWGLRLSNFGAFLLAIALGGGVPNSNLSSYTQEYIVHYGGGVTPFYMYYYLGIVGVFIAAIYVAYLLKKFNWKKSHFHKAFMIYITYTVPRWYLYSMVSIIRGLLIFALVYFICEYCHRMMKNSRKSLRLT